jgi:hypothetical protein
VTPADARAFEVMAAFEQQVEALALGFFEQTQPDTPEIIGGNGVNLHAPKLERGCRLVWSNRTVAYAANASAQADEMALENHSKVAVEFRWMDPPEDPTNVIA